MAFVETSLEQSNTRKPQDLKILVIDIALGKRVERRAGSLDREISIA
jgi:hypothetical protein